MAEAAFGRKNITDGNHQFDLCLRFLAEDTIERVRDVLRTADRVDNPYISLKEELIRLYAPNVLEQLNGIIFAPELGGQPPSQLMNKLLSMLPAGEPAGLLFKHHFILRLPSDIRDQVAKKLEKLSAKELAEYADSRWHVRNSRPPPVAMTAAVEPASIEDLSETVAAMSVGKASRRRRGGKHAGADGRVESKPFVCLRHCKYGKRLGAVTTRRIAAWRET